MTAQHSPIWRRLLFIPPIVLGIAILAWLVSGRQPPQKLAVTEQARVVRVVEAPMLSVTPTAIGYGPAQPARVWAAVAQVPGRVVFMHPRLRNGEILPPDTELLRIDPRDFELALASARANLAELAVQERNARASLTIEQRADELARRELKRIQKLKRQGTVAQADVDNAERGLLTARAATQNLNNTLALIPAQRAVLEAKAAQAERDLEHSVIRAPFALRVAALAVETDQFVAAGQRLFEGDSVARTEVVAQVAMASLRRLFADAPNMPVDVRALNARVRERIGFRPLVRLDLGHVTAEWQAEFVRFTDSIDTKTRTIGVVVAVDKPFEKVIPGLRPPLTKGMFVQVQLSGRPGPEHVVVPRSAVRNGQVWLADKDNRLRARAVRVLYNQQRASVIADGLSGGERVLVSDPVPAVEGMLLIPQIDAATAKALRASASAPR